jgi:predicted GNAT family acetyltransferase
VEISIVNNADVRHVELCVDGKIVGFLAYERTADVLSFTEIETDLALAGQGLGVVLVHRALDAASADGMSVLPVCEFVRDFIERHPRYLELVPADRRERFGLPSET